MSANSKKLYFLNIKKRIFFDILYNNILLSNINNQ